MNISRGKKYVYTFIKSIYLSIYFIIDRSCRDIYQGYEKKLNKLSYNQKQWENVSLYAIIIMDIIGMVIRALLGAIDYNIINAIPIMC